MADAKTVTVASKLPFDFVAETSDGVKVTFKGGNAKDHAGEGYLTEGYGLTPGVDADWFAKWELEVTDSFVPIKTGAIFAEATADKARDAGNERKKNVKTGLEQKTDKELGVEVVKGDDKKD